MNIFFLLLSLFFSTTTFYINAKNYYVIDGANEDNNVIKIWYTVIGLLDEYENGDSAGLEISFNHDGKHFDPNRGSNWWEYYFSTSKIGSSEKETVVRVPRYQRAILRFNTVCTMSPERASFLLKKYIRIQPALQLKIDLIKQNCWPIRTPVVGVFYQKPIMPMHQESWDPLTLCNRVKKEIEGLGECKVCLLTDLPGFEETFKEELGNRFMTISWLANDKDLLGAERGEHELLTLLLLAECDLVISPGSYQGIGAKMVNPSLKLIELDIIPYKRN